MASWSADWEPTARAALIALRGQGATDARGLPLPALSVTDAISTLGIVIQSMIIQLGRPMSDVDHACARTDRVTDGVFDRDAPGSNVYTVAAKDYLTYYPPPPGTGSLWQRSPTAYSVWSAAVSLDPTVSDNAAGVAAWGVAAAGTDPSGATNSVTGYASEVLPGQAVYQPFTPNGYDDTAGQLLELKQMVDSYQHACDAIASGASTQTDMTARMSYETAAAFWSGLMQVLASLDTLSDVPPRPATGEILEQALNDAADAIGKAAAKIANVAGNVVGNAARGALEGIGISGAAIGVLVVYLVLR